MPGSTTRARVATVLAAVMVLMVACEAQIDSQDAYAFSKALSEFYYGTSHASCKTGADVILSEVCFPRGVNTNWSRRPACADHHAEDSMQAVKLAEPSELW